MTLAVEMKTGQAEWTASASGTQGSTPVRTDCGVLVRLFLAKRRAAVDSDGVVQDGSCHAAVEGIVDASHSERSRDLEGFCVRSSGLGGFTLILESGGASSPPNAAGSLPHTRAYASARIQEALCGGVGLFRSHVFVMPRRQGVRECPELGCQYGGLPGWNLGDGISLFRFIRQRRAQGNMQNKVTFP